MAALELEVDISPLIDAIVSGKKDRIISNARALLEQERNADVLLGRIGIEASKGDPQGQVTTTLAVAAMLARLLHVRPAPLDQEVPSQLRTLPLFIRASEIAVPAIQAGHGKTITSPDPFFPSELIEANKSINTVLNESVTNDDVTMIERVLLGFYGTGADYRTMQVRTYESQALSFPRSGYPLQYAVRGFQLLDAVEWSRSVPPVLHWLAPLLVLGSKDQQPAWIATVQQFAAANSLEGIRTRLSAPQNKNALALQQIVQSNADTTKVLQAVHEVIIRGQATPRAAASVLALAAADILARIDANDQERFLHVGNGLLYASAVRNVFRQVQDTEVYNLLYTTAAYLNTIYKEVVSQNQQQEAPTTATAASSPVGGGLIAVTQLETLEEQINARDYAGALSTADRYLKLGHDARALFGTIGLGAALNDHTFDQGHSLQLVLAAGEEYVNWPRDIPGHPIQTILEVALKTATFGKRDDLLANL